MSRRAALVAQPTDAQMRQLYARLRRAHWPDTYEAALAHQWFSKLLRVGAYGAAQTTVAAPAPARQPSIFDPKRLAANDRDDRDE